MPLPNANLFNYTRSAILEVNAGQMGVYWILDANSSVIYIGCGDIRDRMLAHVNGDNPCITKFAPAHWGGDVTPDFEALEKRLIIEFSPPCNKRVG